jgi:hypothetical protein
MRQARSPMLDLLIDCYFNGLCKGRKNFFPTPRYAKNFALCGIARNHMQKYFNPLISDPSGIDS